jgi:hypothetical protein
LFVPSTNHGKTWSKPIEIDTIRGLPRDDNGAIEGFDDAVAPDGTLYAVWTDGTHVVFTASQDGGLTFSPGKNIIDTAPTMFSLQAVARANGFAQISLDPRGGPKGRRLYVTWGDYRTGTWMCSFHLPQTRDTLGLPLFASTMILCTTELISFFSGWR